MLQPIEWTSEYELGIAVIDHQHRRIVEYINTLCDLRGGDQRERIAELIDGLVDYTYSHFAFEEALMEEAGYEHVTIHQRTHNAFTHRIEDFHGRFKQGEDVAEGLGELLQTWLINHIMEDDRSYSALVREKIGTIEKLESGNWLRRTLRHFFN